MKKLISVVVAVAIMATALVGCGEEATTTTENYIPTESDGKTTKLVADNSVKGELNLSFYGDTSEYDDFYLTIAKRKYEELYPNSKINIDYIDFSVSFEDYCKQYATEAMAGKGPDIYVMEYTMDEYKMSKSGAFADLTECFLNDPNFSFDDYNKEAFKACQFDGKQYIVPITYDLPVFLSTQSLIDKSKLDLSKCVDYKSCAEEFGALYDSSDFETPIYDGCMIPISFPLYSGIKWVDYDSRQIKLDNIYFEECLSLLEENLQPLIKQNYSSGDVNMALDLINERFIMKEFSFTKSLTQDYEELTKFDSPVFVPWYNVNGKLSGRITNSVAVNNNSTNIDNAYRFIKILISDECTESISDFLIGFPVNQASMNTVIDAYIDNKSINDNFKKDIDNLMSKIENFTLITTADDYLREITSEYLMGKVTYEECIQSAQSKLEIYISE